MLAKKTLTFLLTSCILLFTVTLSAQEEQPQSEEQPKGKLYELRFYTCNPGKLDDLHARFRDHTMKLFEKHGMENIIYWTVEEGTQDDGDDADNMLVYIIAHKDEASRTESWNGFRDDPEWHAARDKSEENGKLLAKAPRSILMHATDFSPAVEEPNKDSDSPARLFELRHYNDGPERVPHTVERFAFGEKQLFVDAGMETLNFWTADDHSAFIYLLAHKNRDASAESWKKFFSTFRPFLEKYRAAYPDLPQGRGNGIEVRFLVPTDYSPRK